MFAGFGNVEEWKYFEENYPTFIKSVPLLFDTLFKVFTRKISEGDPDVDRVVFQLGIICVEDFKEILLLCANGYGIGGQKLLRSLYEKAVTIDYVFKYPSEATNFIDYNFINMRKDLNHMKINKNDEGLKEEIAYIEDGFEKVRERFQAQRSWSKLDTHSMAKAAESALESLYHSCFFLPTLQSHTTMLAIFSRMKVNEEENFTYFSDEPKRSEAKSVLEFSHFIMLNVIHRQNQHFKLKIDDELMERAKEHDNSWPKEQNG